jgi:hypothetical protein
MPTGNDCNPSVSPQPFQRRWHKCIHAAAAIRDIVQNMPPGMISRLSPLTSATFYLAAVAMLLAMSITENSAVWEGMLAGFEVLLAALRSFARLWEIANAFHGSFTQLFGPDESQLEHSLIDLCLQHQAHWNFFRLASHP